MEHTKSTVMNNNFNTTIDPAVAILGTSVEMESSTPKDTEPATNLEQSDTTYPELQENTLVSEQDTETKGLMTHAPASVQSTE